MFLEERIQEILRQLGELRYPLSCQVPGWEVRKTLGPVRPQDLAGKEGWERLETDAWGEGGAYRAFRVRMQIPQEFQGYRVDFTLQTGREGQWDATNPQMALYLDGELRQGMDVNHTSFMLTEKARGGEEYSLFLSAYTGSNPQGLFFLPALRCVDLGVEDLYFDLRVPWEVLRLLDCQDPGYLWLLPILNEAVNQLDLRGRGDEPFYASLERAKTYLHEHLYGVLEKKRELLEPLMGKLWGKPRAEVVGHTHIDVAWLWTLSVTRDKALRSFATVLELMDRYPEYTFLASQPQLYAYVKEASPELYERIRERVREGRWECEGAMWVEADCNLTSGESLVRQILYGKGFFQREFQKDCRILWLPDVFGYSAALPQIMKKSGIDYFVTTKISWNEKNKMPYDTFLWEGIDGSRVLSHFITTREYDSPRGRGRKSNEDEVNDFNTTYNGFLGASQMMGAWQRYQQKDISNRVFSCYGYGDGGGGPTEEMLEMGRRLTKGLPGAPVVEHGHALHFLESLPKEDFPCWSGELYLEYHRGTYTSMGRNKKYNRRAEFGALNLETYGVLAGRLLNAPYPEKVLERGWEVILRNQFHDILPGSSIYEVYEESQREYLQLKKDFEGETGCLLKGIREELSGEGTLLVLNPNGLPLSGLAEVSGEEGERLLSFLGKTSAPLEEALGLQRSFEGGLLIPVEEVPAKGLLLMGERGLGKENLSQKRAFQYRSLPEGKQGERKGEVEIETPYAILRFNPEGQIESWIDLQEGERELLAPGERGNLFVFYEDKPLRYDNWSLEDYYREKSWEVGGASSFEVLEEGPLRYRIRITWEAGRASRIQEDLCFYRDTPRVDLLLKVSWQEDQSFCKLLFPLDLNVNAATYDIQYGNVTRPTHSNTSWDQARFEVCYHKWLDLSEAGFGVSFLSDCKYGVSVEGSRVGLSVLKSGRYPNPRADREEHEMSFSVYPHLGTWREAQTVGQAYGRNNPLVALVGEGKGAVKANSAVKENSMDLDLGRNLDLDRNPDLGPAFSSGFHARPDGAYTYSLASCREKNICIEVCKRAQKGEGIILRLYEFENRRTRAHLTFDQCYEKIYSCSLLEEKEELLAERAGEVEILVKGYEIVTLLLL